MLSNIIFNFVRSQLINIVPVELLTFSIPYKPLVQSSCDSFIGYSLNISTTEQITQDIH
jgi:hypothetical protein